MDQRRDATVGGVSDTSNMLSTTRPKMVKLMPEQYDGRALCPCCGNDGQDRCYYICADRLPDGTQLAHDESCALYEYGDDLCVWCDREEQAALLHG